MDRGDSKTDDVLILHDTRKQVLNLSASSRSTTSSKPKESTPTNSQQLLSQPISDISDITKEKLEFDTLAQEIESSLGDEFENSQTGNISTKISKEEALSLLMKLQI